MYIYVLDIYNSTYIDVYIQIATFLNSLPTLSTIVPLIGIHRCRLFTAVLRFLFFIFTGDICPKSVSNSNTHEHVRHKLQRNTFNCDKDR